MLKDFCIWGLRGVSEASIHLAYYCEIGACILEDTPKEIAAKKAFKVIHDHLDNIEENKRKFDSQRYQDVKAVSL